MTEEGTQKKGLSPWAWVAIGCGGLIIIAFVIMSAGMWFAGKKIADVAGDFEDNPAKAAAELMVKMNPEVELVESDEDEGTITVRVKETGEVATFDYSEIEEGKLGFTTDEGEMTFDVSGTDEGGIVTVETEEGTAEFRAGDEAGELPDWLPIYPDATTMETGYTAAMEGGGTGSFSFETTDSPGEVFAFLKEEFTAAGFKVQENAMSAGGVVEGGLLVAVSEDETRSAQATISRDGETTQVGVFYSDNP